MKYNMRTIMRKYLALLAGALIIASCQNIQQENEQLTSRNDSLITALQQKNAELESVLTAISDIQAGFDKINEAEGRISIDEDGEMKTSDQTKMKESLDYISKTMESNRKKIEELEDKLKSSTGENASLKKLIKSLNNQLTDKSQQIASLKAELSQRETRISELGDTIKALAEDVKELHEVNQAKEEKIVQQDKQLNRAWYVYGTAKELKERSILKNGKVLTENDFDVTYFTPIDVRNDVSFPLYSKHAEILTTHPASSWHMDENDGGELTLVIDDPARFWSVSRFMVIKVR